ncbi:MAG: UDP-3-O-(3-hydroxymyristoyl)glucosamine N-acyltransferase [Marinosulfonomonas sp.]|nr:UDP-3-O-(3-hydroxymyristoyl)glucosamine N-acyltransferase [Marinosulfonomonas sp.]
MTAHSVKDMAQALSAHAEGDLSIVFKGVAEPAEASTDDLALAMAAEFVASIPDGAALAAIVPVGTDWQAAGLKAAIFVDRPRLAMAGLTGFLSQSAGARPSIHPSAIIDPTASIGANCSVGPYSVIGARVQIGENSVIGSHVSIEDGAVIGADAVLQSGARIGRNVQIGARFFAHSGVVIGSDGFSFVTPEPSVAEKARKSLGKDSSETPVDQDWLKIHSLGGVIIGNNVEVGANSCIDAGTVRATRIGEGTKIDDLVQVAHNVVVGTNCLLCGHVGIAGSAQLGNNVVLGGQVGVGDNITIGDQVVAGGGSKILSNVPKGRAVLGYPATKMAGYIQSYKALRRLPRLMRDFDALQKSVSNKRDTD